MELTVHSIIRGVERGIDPHTIKKTVYKFWNNLRYNFHKKSFYVIDNQEKYAYIVQDKNVITLYKIEDWKHLLQNSLLIPRSLRPKLKDYFFEDIELDIHLFRELDKLGIVISR